MKEILKILKAYKAGKITEKELTILLEIKKRGLFVIAENKLVGFFQVWNKNTCLLTTEKKEEAEAFVINSEKLLKLCLE